MDNASKALIMAGAILLAVAIVGLGVYFFSMSEGLTDQAGDSITNLSTDLQNSELFKFEGDNVRGTDIHTLARHLGQIRADWAETITVYYEGGNFTGNDVTEANIKGKINKGHVYTVEMQTGSTGFVKYIRINDNSTPAAPAAFPAS